MTSITVKTGSIIKFIAINVIVLFLLVFVVNWACGVWLKKSTRTHRSELPNYGADHEHARAVFTDYNRIQHHYEPFVGWRALPFSGKTTHISREGLRTHYPDSASIDNRTVVRFFGGSTMWGEGSDDLHTIPALFNKLNPGYRVFNHGQLAYNTRQELDELISVYTKGEQADVVIFYDGVNDAAFLCPREISALPAHRLVPMYREKLYTGKSYIIKTLAYEIFLEDMVKVIQHFTYNPTPERSPYDCTTNPDKAEAIAEMMLRNWEMAHQLVTSRNGTFYAILQPAAYIGSPRIDHLNLDHELGKNFQMIYDLVRKKIAERNHPWIVDMSRVFDGDEYVFIDFCHVSPNGNEVIARELSKVINDLSE